MRAKMRINSIEKHESQETLKMSAVGANSYPDDGSSEDNTYAKWTPSASLEITVTNPDLMGKFEPGQKYYLDFTAADE